MRKVISEVVLGGAIAAVAVILVFGINAFLFDKSVPWLMAPAVILIAATGSGVGAVVRERRRRER